jgi:hypothetical protein
MSHLKHPADRDIRTQLPSAERYHELSGILDSATMSLFCSVSFPYQDCVVVSAMFCSLYLILSYHSVALSLGVDVYD